MLIILSFPRSGVGTHIPDVPVSIHKVNKWPDPAPPYPHFLSCTMMIQYLYATKNRLNIAFKKDIFHEEHDAI
jgi:hypothetical protein